MSRTKLLGGALALLFTTSATADLFPPQNPKGPRGAAEQTNYPYPGQCVADPTRPWGVPACDAAKAPSFACEGPSGASNQTAGPWRTCGAATPPVYTPVAPIISDSSAAAAIPTPKFQWEALNPLDYVPDQTKFLGADYYEIGLHEANGFQQIASAGLFPNPGAGTCATGAATAAACDVNSPLPAACAAFNPAGACTATFPGATAVPAGMQWTGLVCTIPTGCSCPNEASAAFAASYCSLGGKVPPGGPLFTQIWGVGQMNGGPVEGVLGAPTTPATSWSANNYFATWPSISIRATKGRPVVVKWVNEFPNNHVFCPHPEAADWPCAIDRTFMGVKAKIDPATAPAAISPDGVNRFGSPQQPDNSWVTHLHGGDIPPATDGFAMKWFGNKNSGPLYSPAPAHISPHFDGPASAPHVMRPGGDPLASTIQSYYYDTYTYPMNQDEATIWFHDHTLGKTHHNVIAGPAGFFPVKDPSKHGAVAGLTAGGVNCLGPGTCEYTWLDPVTEPRGALGIPKYDLFFAIQDRAFNADGSINFSNGIGQGASTTVPPPPDPRSAFVSTDPGGVVNGVNPDVHPTWVPEYFGDHAVVNGVIWPKKTVEAGWHRIRFANGSDSRCWTLGLSTTQPAPGTRPNNNVRFTAIASDQGYLPTPRTNLQTLTMCPGERYEILVDFGRIPGRLAGAPGPVYLTNSAAAPFPAGNTPWAAPLVAGGINPDREMNVVMRFDVNGVAGVPTCGVLGLTYDPVAEKAAGWPSKGCIRLPVTPDPSFVDLRYDAVKGVLLDPLTGAPRMCGAGFVPQPGVVPNCVSAVRHLYLNERVDGTTLFPLGMQINGVPFEYKVTETPRQGTIEMWKIINLTVDAHPMHPHLVKHLRVSTQRLNVGAYKRALCGSTTCQPGTAPGNEMQLVPDVEALGPNGNPLYLQNAPVMQLAADFNGGYKDASVALPGQVTTILAFWDGAWTPATGATPALAANAATAPGTGTGSATQACSAAGAAGTICDAATWTYPPVVTGPYVWHCHINSHEDSEMMRTSLVVPATP